MTVLEYIKLLDSDCALHCTFKVLGHQSWFFYFVKDDTENFDWDLVTWEDLSNWYHEGIKWLEEEGPSDYVIDNVELRDEPSDEKYPFIKYRLVIRCKEEQKCLDT